VREKKAGGERRTGKKAGRKIERGDI